MNTTNAWRTFCLNLNKVYSKKTANRYIEFDTMLSRNKALRNNNMTLRSDIDVYANTTKSLFPLFISFSCLSDSPK